MQQTNDINDVSRLSLLNTIVWDVFSVHKSYSIVLFSSFLLPKPLARRTLYGNFVNFMGNCDRAGNPKSSALTLTLYGNPQSSAVVFSQKLSSDRHCLEVHGCIRAAGIAGA